jgi:hypothetical protein
MSPIAAVVSAARRAGTDKPAAIGVTGRHPAKTGPPPEPPDARSYPHRFSGLKIAITFATIGIIVGEFFTAQAGLGYMILFGVAHVGCR